MTGRLQSRTSGHRTFCDYVKRAVHAHNATNHGECDCGNPSRSTDGICARCAFLDGDDNATGIMISALREQDGSTLQDLADTLGMTPRAVLRVIADLRRIGRVRSGYNFGLFQRPAGRWGKQNTRGYWEAREVAVHFLVES